MDGIILTVLKKLRCLFLSKRDDNTVLQIVQHGTVSFFIVNNHFLIRKSPFQMRNQKGQLIVVRGEPCIKEMVINFLKAQKAFHVVVFMHHFASDIIHLPNNWMMLGMINAAAF